MKKILLSTLLAILAFSTARGQVGEARRGIALGCNAGVALNTVGFDPTIKQFMHVGPTLGVTARFTSELYFNILCALQIELNYTRLGWRENVLDSNTEPLPDRYQRHQNYVQLPLLARLGFGREDRGLMGYFVAGPQLGYLFSERTKQGNAWTRLPDGNPDRPNGMFEQYAMSPDKKLDYGITAGLGLELHTAVGHFMVEGRYYYGLGDLWNNGKKDVFARSNNNTIVAKVTYLFDLRKERGRGNE